MRVFEGKAEPDGFLEKEAEFSLKNGMRVDANFPVKIYFKTENMETYIPVQANRFPPIDVKIISFILEQKELEEDNFVPEELFYVDIFEDPDCIINWPSSHILNIANNKMQHLSASLTLPKILRGVPYEVGILQQDGLSLVISKPSDRFKLNEKTFDCYSLNSMINYNIRVRAKIEGKTSEWSNWIRFKPEKKRSLGRTF